MKQSFNTWKREVDRCCEQLCGLSCDDLPDYDFYGAWESGATPLATARRVIKAAQDF